MIDHSSIHARISYFVSQWTVVRYQLPLLLLLGTRIISRLWECFRDRVINYFGVVGLAGAPHIVRLREMTCVHRTTFLTKQDVKKGWQMGNQSCIGWTWKWTWQLIERLGSTSSMRVLVIIRSLLIEKGEKLYEDMTFLVTHVRGQQEMCLEASEVNGERVSGEASCSGRCATRLGDACVSSSFLWEYLAKVAEKCS
jgi:hypothetical protein